MKSGEFRFNNWYHPKGTPEDRWDQLNINNIHLFGEMEGIPLTEECLEKVGWRIEKPFGNRGFNTHAHFDKWCIELLKNVHGWWVLSPEMFDRRNMKHIAFIHAGKFEFVHQIQTFMFSITAEELPFIIDGIEVSAASVIAQANG